MSSCRLQNPFATACTTYFAKGETATKQCILCRRKHRSGLEINALSRVQQTVGANANPEFVIPHGREARKLHPKSGVFKQGLIAMIALPANGAGSILLRSMSVVVTTAEVVVMTSQLQQPRETPATLPNFFFFSPTINNPSFVASGTRSLSFVEIPGIVLLAVRHCC